MTESKKSQPASKDDLAKTSPKGSVELSEAQLADAAGGSLNFTSQQNTGGIKLFGGQKPDSDPALLLPAVKPGQ